MAMFDALHLYLFYKSDTLSLCRFKRQGLYIKLLECFHNYDVLFAFQFYSELTNEQLSAWFCNCRSYIEADSASRSGRAFVF